MIKECKDSHNLYSIKNRMLQKLRKRGIFDIIDPFFKFLLIFALVYFLINFLITPKTLIFSPGGDSTTYLISTLLQSLATILALGATITIVVMQMSSQHYTPRIVNIFIRKTFLHLILIYGLIISLGVFLLADVGFYSQNKPKFIELFIILALSGIFYLLPYFYSIGNLLKSSTIVRDLLKDIIFLDFFKDIYCEERNPFQPVLDITINALESNDNETSRLGIQKISQTSEDILNEMFRSREKIGQGIRFTKKSVLISKETIFSLTSTKILRNLEELGFNTIRNKNIERSHQIVNSLHSIGKTLVKNFPASISSIVAVHLNLLTAEKTSRAPGKISVMILEGDVLASVVGLSKIFVDLYQEDKKIMSAFFDFFVREMREKVNLKCVREIDTKIISEDPQKIIAIIENCEKEVKERYKIVYA